MDISRKFQFTQGDNMKKLIKTVLSEFKGANLESEAARERIAKAIIDRMRNNDTGWHLNLGELFVHEDDI